MQNDDVGNSLKSDTMTTFVQVLCQNLCFLLLVILYRRSRFVDYIGHLGLFSSEKSIARYIQKIKVFENKNNIFNLA